MGYRSPTGNRPAQAFHVHLDGGGSLACCMGRRDGGLADPHPRPTPLCEAHELGGGGLMQHSPIRVLTDGGKERGHFQISMSEHVYFFREGWRLHQIGKIPNSYGRKNICQSKQE